MANNLGAFFSGTKDDIRGNLYFECCVNPDAPLEPSKAGSTGCVCTHLITAKDYNNKQGKRDGDIHPEFIKFIEDVGKWHGYLDNKSDSGYRTANDSKISEWLSGIKSRGGFSNPEASFYNNFMSPLWRADPSQPWQTLENDKEGFGLRGMGSIFDLINKVGANNVRINMKKNDKDGFILFAKSLPVYEDHLFGRDYENAFKEAQGGSLQSAETKFDLQLDQFYRDLLHAVEKPSERDYWLEGEMNFDRDVVFRDLKDPNMLMVNDGVPTSESDLEKKIGQGNCMSTGVNFSSGAQCQQVLDCFLKLDKSLSNCTAVISNTTGLWNADASVVGKMLPSIAFKVLQNLKFMGEMKWDVIAHRKLLKVQSFDSWFNMIMNDPDVDQKFKDALKGNKNAFANYICLVIDFVNANPAILNKDYVGPSEQTNGMPTGVSDKKDKYGLVSYYVFPGRGDFRGLAEKVKAKTARLRLTGSPLTLAVGGYPLVQAGGSLSTPLTTTRYQMQNCGAKVLSDIYIVNLRKLRSQGKDLSQHTRETIEKEIRGHIKSEYRLVEILNFLERYVRIQNVMRSVGGLSGGAETVTMTDVVKEVEAKYHALLERKERRELNLLSILETLINAVADGNKVELNLGERDHNLKPLDARN